jgi:SAM-dependent methyltransferase
VASALAAAAGPLAGGGAVLDAGCGHGWWLRRLAAEGVEPGRLHGLDLLPARVTAARAAVPGAAVREGDLRALPYGDGAFTAVFAFTVLSSLGGRPALAQAVAELWRVLAPGGVLVAWEPRVPTLNPATRRVGARELAAACGAEPEGRSVTVLPPLARRLGPATGRWYPRLARVPVLRTHRLHALRRPGGGYPPAAP